ncbi:hypothetical protein NSA47_12405 [Irregularibacter muris]|uniref:Uncharacterized protein n=1 Tax=Irregularibacter muris TaxID=1796619 RepID=A0AAE3L328_9FIRM|nr:hypothetical protein [Irregularibacter muris]MCR1899774.1 hypothetical protein [Irregularibacter muris]
MPNKDEEEEMQGIGDSLWAVPQKDRIFPQRHRMIILFQIILRAIMTKAPMICIRG